MTQIYKKIIASIAISISFLSFFSGISAQAQYGGTTIILNPSNSTSGSTNPTNTPSSSPTIITPTNRCAGSNTSSSVAGDTVNINLCNIKSGNTVTINNLTTNSLESLELTFTSNIEDGLFQIVKIPDSLVFPNLSGSFINGFELLTTRFDRSAISNIKLTYKVDKSLINRYSNVRAYTSSSPWVSTNLNNVSEDNSFVRFTTSTPVLYSM